MSSRSLSVSAPADSPPPWRLMPLLLPSSPPTSTRVLIRGPSMASDLQADLAVVEQQHVADEHVRGQLLVRDADRMVVAGIDGERRRRA